MKKLIMVLFILTSITILYSQDTNRPFKKEMWLFKQRSYPDTIMDESKYSDAIGQMQSFVQNNGYIDEYYGWAEIGPKPGYNSWYNGNQSGRVQSVKVAGNGYIYIGATGGGVWRSTNNGNYWSPLTDFQNYNSIGDIVIDPDDDEIIYAGTGGAGAWPYRMLGNGVYKSTNGGVNWTLHNFIINGQPLYAHVNRLVIFDDNNLQTQNNLIFAATTKGLLKSTNGGVNWTVISADVGSTLGKICSDVVFSYTSNIVFAIGPKDVESFIFRGVGYLISTDGGITFARRNDLFLPNSRSLLAVTSVNPNVLYIISNNDGQYGRIYKSTNNGQNFINGYGWNLSAEGYQWDFDLLLNVSPINENIVFVGIKDLWRSENGGQNFIKVAGYNSNAHPDMHALNFDKNDTENLTILLGCDGGIWKSNDLGDNWDNLNTNLSTSLIYRITTSPNNYNDVWIGLQDNSWEKKNYSSVQWTGNYSYDGTQIVYSRWDPNSLLAGAGNYRDSPPAQGPFFRYNFINNQWDDIAPPPGSFDSHLDWIAPLIPGYTPGLWYSARRIYEEETWKCYFWTSTNNGSNWYNGNSNNYHDIVNNNESPQHLEIVPKSPYNFIYAVTGGWPESIQEQNIYISTDYGANWSQFPTTNLPNLYVSRILCNVSENSTFHEVYVTLSGFNPTGNSKHIFMTTNEGSNWNNCTWTNITEDLPNCPVNDIVMRKTGPNIEDREFYVGTDLGVFTGVRNQLTGKFEWKVTSRYMPNVIVMDLEYIPLLGKLRAATWGRSVWQTTIGSEEYWIDNDIITTSENDVIVDVDLIIGDNSILSFPYNTNIKMANGKKIIIKDGGSLYTLNNSQVTISSQSGTWGGIEIQGDANVNLNNIRFENTSTPITVTGNQNVNYMNSISIDSCTFVDGEVSVDSRNNVSITNCTWEKSNTLPEVLLSSVNASDLNIEDNIMEFTGGAESSTAMQITYGNTITISNNSIKNLSNGILVSNSSPAILNNNIVLEYSVAGSSGIGMDNAYNPAVNSNIIIGYDYGINLYSSSPTLLSNTCSGSSMVNGLNAVYYSSPRLHPAIVNNQRIDDAGYNEFSPNNTGIYLSESSYPDVEKGHNIIYGNSYYMAGEVDVIMYNFNALENCWIDDPVDEGKFNILNATVSYDPVMTCPGGGGSLRGSIINKDNIIENITALNEDNIPISTLPNADPEPPVPIIVNYGNNTYDTILVSSTNVTMSQAYQLYSEAMSYELNGNYTEAKNKYLNVIQNHAGTLPSVNSLKRLLYCLDRSEADSAQYNWLRNYYMTQYSQHLSDTLFSVTAHELAVKSLVRLKQYAQAITEYENIISNSTNQREIMNAELNIIETYLLLPPAGGNTVSFTGTLVSLKPAGKKEALRMIRERIYKTKHITRQNIIPDAFVLHQNYPNPFNPVTTIKYGLPKDGTVSILIYDITGRLLKTLIDEYKQAGTYEAKFDGSQLASGVYFYKMISESFVESKKMILVK